MKMFTHLGALALLTVGSSTASAAIAYNDFSTTDIGATTPPAGKFVTGIHPGQSGNLLDYDTGEVIATMSSSGGTTTHVNAAGADIGSPNTPLYNHFNGFVNLTGAAYGPGVNTITFSNLNPGLRYIVTVGINRGVAGPSNEHWYQEVTIGGVNAFTNTSTLADIGIGVGPVTIPSISGPDDPSTYATANNNWQVNSSGSARVSTDGAIVQFSDIDPGPDGSFTLTLSLVQGTNQYVNALSLQAVPEPASLGLAGLGAVLLLSRGRRSRPQPA